MADHDEKQLRAAVTADPGHRHDDNDHDRGSEEHLMTEDEYHLASLGYKQVLVRGLSIFENWAATFTTMNFVSGMPVLFGFAMYTGGPQAAFTNWTMVGLFSLCVSLVLAEIAAAFPTTGGIYYWSYRLGGRNNWGPLLSWLTAWWNWVGWITVVPGVQQGTTNFLIATLQIAYPDLAVLEQRWFAFVLTCAGLIVATLPNIYGQRVLRWYFRFTVFSAGLLFVLYWIWLPVKASRLGFHPENFTIFYNGINFGAEKQAGDAYCWVVAILFGAWEFYGYDASVHLAEETKSASAVVARGMWLGTLTTWLLSVPTLMLFLFCMQDFMAVAGGSYANNFAEFAYQIVGKNGAMTLCVLCWLDGTCCTTICILSAQRVTYALARDGLLPGSKYFRRLSKRHKTPVNAALLVLAIGIVVCVIIIGSTVAFFALTATATIATNVSYFIPIVARQTVGRRDFKPAKWHLGRWSLPLAIVAGLYICFLFVILDLPQVYPVTAQTLNYAPIMIGGVTVLSLVGWVFPFGLGGRHWFEGPRRTISEQDFARAQVVDLKER